MAQLQFKGKTFVQNHHLLVKYHELVPVKAKSLTDKVSLHDNLIIHGDNLKALKALLPLYAGKVKCVYIDPPYNTGNEGWAYNDNVSSPMMQEWLGKVVDREDLTRHDKWLCMMMPRLKLLRELLRDDGAIFISIDDNEQGHLRLLMDDVFGEDNFVANVIWQKKFAPQNDARYFSDNHDFVVVYAKSKDNWTRNLLPTPISVLGRYSNPDNDPRGDWSSGDISVKTYSANCDYPIKSPSGRIVQPSKSRCWMFTKEKFAKLVKDNRIWFGLKGDNVPRLKQFRSEIQEGIVPITIWMHENVGHNQEAKQELKEIFQDSDLPFDTPKPVRLVRRILDIASDKDAIILDSFAGSAPTAQAVLELNKEDGGNRRFILIECEDYADTITAERVRRVIKGVQTAKDEALKKGLGGTFSFFKLGKPLELESILDGDSLPTYEELARYVFYTATGEEFDPAYAKASASAKAVADKSAGRDKADDKYKNFIGESRNYQVFLFYEPDVAKLKNLAFTLDMA
ncbi:MAG: site-specific DNA-methyltransferase, partial [Kiritimatiellia bacterium]|nr:site-specific DNA-methyltransferase [Kiritimatiellia bacterium]